MLYDEIQGYCHKKKMTLAEFERSCGIGNGTIEKWNKRNSVPTLKTLIKIEAFTGVPINAWIKEVR